MESALNIRKRKCVTGLVLQKCVFCQKVKKGDVLRASSAKGLNTFKEAALKRVKYKCDQYSELLLNRELIDLSDMNPL
jgi:hypothetical protein